MQLPSTFDILSDFDEAAASPDFLANIEQIDNITASGPQLDHSSSGAFGLRTPPQLLTPSASLQSQGSGTPAPLQLEVNRKRSAAELNRLAQKRFRAKQQVRQYVEVMLP